MIHQLWFWRLNVSRAQVFPPPHPHTSPSPPTPQQPMSSRPVLGFHINVMKEEFSFCIFRGLHFRVAILSHFKREMLIKPDQTSLLPSVLNGRNLLNQGNSKTLTLQLFHVGTVCFFISWFPVWGSILWFFFVFQMTPLPLLSEAFSCQHLSWRRFFLGFWMLDLKEKMLELKCHWLCTALFWSLWILISLPTPTPAPCPPLLLASASFNNPTSQTKQKRQSCSQKS